MKTEAGFFNRRSLAYAVLGPFAIFLPIALCQSDLALILYFSVGLCLVLVSASLLVKATLHKKPNTLSMLAMVAIFWIISLPLAYFCLRNSLEIRTTTRWLIRSGHYKALVLANPAPFNGAFKHIDWDGWGWAGMDTNVYLVFDPTDSLSTAAAKHQPGKLNGIPCDVYRVFRLEKSWYTVLFYTDEFWDRPGCW